jgi:hypothetical protein
MSRRSDASGQHWIHACGVLAVFTFCLLLVPNPSHAQLVVQERGFDVTTLAPGVGAKGIECSPGGIWGDFVYVADSNGGVIETIDFADNVSLFASGLSFPVGIPDEPCLRIEGGLLLATARSPTTLRSGTS